MKSDWLWDRRMSDSEAIKALKNPNDRKFIILASLLLARQNEPKMVFKKYMDPVIFCEQWRSIKREMRKNKWYEPRIIFWQAIYEKLKDKYMKKGLIFKKKGMPAKDPLLEKIGHDLSLLRRQSGLSQKDIAKRLRVSQQLISRIEKGRENISLITLQNITSALNKKVEIIVGDGSFLS